MAVNGALAAVEAELAWLQQVLEVRLALHFETPCAHGSIDEIAAPGPCPDRSPFDAFAAELRPEERLVLALALAPSVRPQLLDLLLVQNPNLGRGFTEFGGHRGRYHAGFLPTCETAAFLWGGEDLSRRAAVLRRLHRDQPLQRGGALRLGSVPPGEPPASAPLTLHGDWLARMLGDGDAAPGFGSDFPAHRLSTALTWDDLVLPAPVLEEIEQIRRWLVHGPTLRREWGLDRTLAAGYRCLFYGPSGTGKTLTATLLGQACERDVYRIDLSLVVSKYIGETEKNLAEVFDLARSRSWILFFDEADALFGKRTQTSSAHDRYANQEVSYLLQRIEDFDGVVILASNFKQNIDAAFARRFQAMVHFPMPDADERLRLWRGLLEPTGHLAADVDLGAIAGRHPLSGGSIRNVVQFAAVRAIGRPDALVGTRDLLEGIERELRKEGRTG